MSQHTAEQQDIQTYEPSKVGMFSGVSMDEYRKAPGIAKSDLDHLHPTPADYLYRKNQPPKPPTKDQIIGTIIHSLILEPDTAEETFYRIPEGMDFRKNEGKAWRATHYDKPAIDSEDMAGVSDMVFAVRANPEAIKLFNRGVKEQCLFTFHGPTGLLRKGRPDCITETADGIPLIVDLKTVRDIARLEADVAEWRYHVQAAYYSDLLQDIICAEEVRFKFVAVGKTPPHHVRVVSLHPRAIALGRETYQRELEIVAKCEAEMNWPGYPDNETIDLPRWAYPRQNEISAE